MKEAGIPGLGAALIVDKKVVWMKGYGFADRTRRVPFTPDTVMNTCAELGRRCSPTSLVYGWADCSPRQVTADDGRKPCHVQEHFGPFVR